FRLYSHSPACLSPRSRILSARTMKRLFSAGSNWRTLSTERKNLTKRDRRHNGTCAPAFVHYSRSNERAAELSPAGIFPPCRFDGRNEQIFIRVSAIAYGYRPRPRRDAACCVSTMRLSAGSL